MNAVSLLTGTITFNDVAQGSSFSDWFANQLSSFTPLNVAIALVAALIAGLVISTVYKKTFRGVLYSPSFTLTLILLCLVTTPVVMAIGSNVALSMGMVGALSIVRFRTAVKDPLDTAYMFWAITMGILLGSNAYIPKIRLTEADAAIVCSRYFECSFAFGEQVRVSNSSTKVILSAVIHRSFSENRCIIIPTNNHTLAVFGFGTEYD